jgi:hypothetical protein
MPSPTFGRSSITSHHPVLEAAGDAVDLHDVDRRVVDHHAADHHVQAPDTRAE